MAPERFRSRRRRTLAAACLLVLAAVGCSTDDTPPAPQPSASEPSEPSGTSAATDSDGVTPTCEVTTAATVLSSYGDTTHTSGGIALRTNGVGASYRYIVVIAPMN